MHDISKADLWWSDPWWEDTSYQNDTGLSLGEVRARVAVLMAIFNREWIERAYQAGPPNAIIPLLSGGTGLWPFQHLMWLGEIMCPLANVPTLRRPLDDLIGPKSRATLFELETASWFASRQWDVEFPNARRDKKTPDIYIQKSGVHSAIECKNIEPEQWEEWAGQLALAVLRRMDDSLIAHDVSFDVLFAPRLSDLNCGPEPLRREIINEFADRIARALIEAQPIAKSVQALRIPGIADIKFFPERQASQRGVGGIEISPHAKMRKILQNAVFVGAQQLAEGVPGAVVVHSDYAPAYDLADAVLRAANRSDPSLMRSTAYVVIVSTINPPIVWQNPSLVDHPVSQALADVLKVIFRGAQFPSPPRSEAADAGTP